MPNKKRTIEQIVQEAQAPQPLPSVYLPKAGDNRPKKQQKPVAGTEFSLDSDAAMTFGIYAPPAAARGRVGNVLGAGGTGWLGQQLNTLGYMLSPEGGKDAEMMFGTKDADNALAKKNAEKLSKWFSKQSEKLYEKADEYTKQAQEHTAEAKKGLGKGGQLLVDAGIAATQMGMDIGIGRLTGTGMASMGTRTFGSASREALDNGASYEEAGAYGFGSAAVELATEKIFDTAKLFGGGAADELAEKLVKRLAKTPTGRTIWRTMISAAEEGGEEVISDLARPLLQAMTYEQGAAKKAYGTKEGRREMRAELLSDFTVGGILGLLGGGTAVVTGENAVKNERLNALEAAQKAAQQQKQRTNNLSSDTTKQAVRARLALLGQTQNVAVTAEAITKQAAGMRLNEAEIAALNTPAAAQAYTELMDAFNMNGGDANVWARQALGDTVLPTVNRTIDRSLKVGDATPENIRTLQSIQNGEEVTGQELADVMRNRELTRNWMRTMGVETDDNISDQELEKMFRRSVAQQQGKGEEWARSQLTPENQARYDAATSDTAKSGILAGASDEAISTAERLSQAIGRRIVFVSKESNWNGDYDSSTGVMRLNANSENPVAQIIGHELTHSIETAGESYTELLQLVSRRLGDNLTTYRENIRQLYAANGVELDNTHLDHEMLAKYVEENLLTDEASIQSLVKNDRTLGQVIKNFLDRILGKLGNAAAQERAFIQRARDLYALALQDAPVTSVQLMEDLSRRYRNKEITEEEYDAAYDRAYSAEDALRADVQNSFATTKDGKKYVKADRQVIYGNDPDVWKEQVEDYINYKIRKGEDVALTAEDGDILLLTKDTAGKASFRNKVHDPATGRSRPMTDDEYFVKLNAEAHIDELAQVSVKSGHAKDNLDVHSDFASGGWDYRTAYFEDFDGEYYRIRISVAKSSDGDVVYNIGDIRKRSRTADAGSSADTAALNGRSTSQDSTVSNSENDVKGKNTDAATAELKKNQLNAILGNHPAEADDKVWIRSEKDISTFQEAVSEFGEEADPTPDYTMKMVRDALKNGFITVYSSNRIRKGTFVTPSKMEAQNYSADGTVYQKRIPLEHVAWIDIFEGQYTGDVTKRTSANGIPAPPKSSTLQNSFSAKTAEGVELPKADGQTQAEQKAPDGVVLPKAETKTLEERLPKRAQTYLKKAKRNAAEKIARALDLPPAAEREFMDEHLKEVTEEYLKSGKISEKTRERIFQQAYDQGRVVVDDFYKDHKHVKELIRTTPLNADSVKGDIADYGAFRRQHMGTLNLVSKGGSNIDTFYDELHEIEPGLFPQSENNTHDRLMKILEVADSIQKAEYTLREFYGSMTEEHQAWARNDFEAAMDELTSELRLSKRFAEDENAITPEEPVTAENVQQAYKELKEHRRTYEKAAARNLLTEADEVAVGRILRGEDTADGLDPRKYNVKGIRDVVEAKREYEQTARKIRKYKQDLKKARRDTADTYLDTVMAWRDKKTGAQYSRETMERNIRDIVANKEDARRVIEAYFTPVHAHEAAATRMKNEYRARVKGMNLSRKIADGNTVSEAHAVQLLGEAMDNMKYLEQHKRVENRDGKTYEEWQAVVRALWESSPKLNRAKIENAVEEFRKIYDELFQQMNEVRIRNGYEPINYRQGYFPHFQPGDSSGLLEQFSRALGISADVTSLPTTINGLTHQFRPGIRWFGNAQERLGFNTTYDAVEGFDKYIEGAADVINHTDDIQNLRALSDQIRYRSSDKGIQEQADKIRKMDNLTDEEKQTLLDETYKKARTHLGNFVVELEEYTNLLANKRSRADRDMEQRLGRNMYNLAKRFESRVAANMVAINPGSWLTNFIPLTQGWTTTGSRHILQGAFETLKSFKESDGMLERSSFLTNRKGSDPLVKMWEQSSKAPTKWQKVSAFGGRAGEILSSPMEYIDQFTAGTLVRARYNQNVSRGMSEDAAIAEADAWAAGIMADRSKGSTPTVFSQQNPLKKVFTQFQLEVNNELSWLAKDVPDELKKKTLGGIALSIFKFLVGTYLFNDLYEALVGRRSALDPLGILNDTVGDLTGYQLPNLIDLARGEDDFKTKKKDLYDTTSDIGKEVAENLPFVGGVLGGGRVPISSALPDLDNLSKAVGKSGLSGKKRAQLIGKELGNTAAYVVLPFGGSQLKKAYQGVKAVAEGGSYSVDKDGNKLMQYPVYNDSTGAVIANGAKALLFGKSSLRGAREWVENDFKSMSAKQTKVYQEISNDGVKQEEAYELIRQISAEKGEGANARKTEIIKNSNLTDGQKQALYSALVSDSLDEEYSDLKKAGISWGKMMDASAAKKTMKGADLAAWVDSNYTEKEASAIRATFKISSEKYDEMRELGMSPDDAKKMIEVLSNLEALEGQKKVTDLQKYQAIADSNTSDDAKAKAIKSVMRDDVRPKYEAAEKYNVKPADYVAAYAKVVELKTKYGKSVNASIAKEAIDSIPGLTKKQRAALWQVQKKNFNPANNPYDVTVGQIVYNIQYGLNDNSVVLP